MVIRIRHVPTEGLLAITVAAAVGLLIFPVPTALIDGLLAVQLGVAIVVLIAALGSRRPLDLSTFPAILLLTTLFRLALNVSTTRLILAEADAGQVVSAFGDAVVANNLVVGAVVFSVLTIVQYLVIAKGAERVAQVGARFALDGLPGQQLAIDADVRAGLLDPEAARARRRQLARESGLFGAMDGAMKFVRGDAIAGLCIVGVNVVGGLAIGVAQRGMSLGEAVRVYTMLTVGDGLVSQLPAMLTATAAAFVATKVASPESAGLGSDIARQFASSRPLWTAAGLLLVLALLPGLPTVPLALVALALGGIGVVVRPKTASNAPAPQPKLAHRARLRLVLHPEAVVALGSQGARTAIEAAHHRLAEHHRLHLPEPSVLQEGAGLPPGGYRVEIDGATVARGVLPPGKVFAHPAPQEQNGMPAPDPRLGAQGRWVESGAGLSASTYLSQHLESTCRQHSDLLISLQSVADRLAQLEEHAPALIRAVVPKRTDLARLTWLLQRLLAEDVPISDLRVVLAVLATSPVDTQDKAAQLTYLREGLAAQITQHCAPEGHLDAIYIDAALEEQLRAGRLGIDTTDAMLDQVESLLSRHPRAILVVASDVREAVHSMISTRFPGAPVITGQELLPQVQAVTVGLLD